MEVRSIVDPGADVHSFQPTPGDSVAISRAKLIVSNGRGLDAFLDPVIDAAKSSDALHIVAAEGIEFSAPQKLKTRTRKTSAVATVRGTRISGSTP